MTFLIVFVPVICIACLLIFCVFVGGTPFHHGGCTPSKRAISHNFISTISMGGKKPPKRPEYYKGLKDEYKEFISNNELLPVPSAMDAVAAWTISLLTIDIKPWKFMAVSKEAMEALKALIIKTKVLAQRSSAMWGILLASEEAAKSLVECILVTQNMRLQTEDMGTRKSWINLHGVPIYITEDHLRAFFTEYGPLDGVSSIKSKILRSW